MLSNTCKYALRAVLYLAINQDKDNKIGIKQISSDLSIPRPFLGKILQQLAKYKLLHSSKGPNGGFSLGKNAYDISLYDIVEIIDGKEMFYDCLIGMQVCKDDSEKQKICPLHPTADATRLGIMNLFKNHNLGKITEDVSQLDVLLKF